MQGGMFFATGMYGWLMDQAGWGRRRYAGLRGVPREWRKVGRSGDRADNELVDGHLRRLEIEALKTQDESSRASGRVAHPCD
jgi:hypothetical protein